MVSMARQVALSVLEKLERSNETLDILLADALEKKATLSRRDRALTTELVFGTVRWKGRLDWYIQHTSRIPLSKITPRILQILRLGLYQILFLSKVPPASAVDESVKLAKKKAPKWVVGYVNGVLRAAVRNAKEVPFPDENDGPTFALSVEESFPPWLIERWVERMGLPQTKQLCRACNRIPPVTIRANRLKVTREHLTKALGPFVKEIRPTPYAPDGLILKGMLQPIGHMKPFRKGLFQVQDEAAQLVSLLLDPQPGEKVLDGCAGLGGKTGHVAQLMNNSGHITAADIHNGRLKSLCQAMTRQGIILVKTWSCDMSSSFPGSHDSTFDRVLIDAPCSGLGVIRRNPDAKWKKRPSSFSQLATQQMNILDSVSPLVKSGGILVYCVCSMEPEEGDDVLKGFLKTHDDFVIDGTSSFSVCLEVFCDQPGIFRSLPHKHDMDGFFAVRLRRI